MVVGRYFYKASMLSYTKGITKGMVPKARIVIYKVLWLLGWFDSNILSVLDKVVDDSVDIINVFWLSGCFDSDILSMLDKVVDNGVDVISLSVRGSIAPYFLDNIPVGTFSAMQRGVFVSKLTGNNIPGDATMTNVVPWITTVGPDTMDCSFPVDIVLGDGSVKTGVSMYSGKGLAPGRQFPLVYASDAS